MTQSELEALRTAIANAHGSTTTLHAVFADLADSVGRGRASELWWAVFGAEDASET